VSNSTAANPALICKHIPLYGTTKVYTTTSTPVLGTYFYTDQCLTIPFVGYTGDVYFVYSPNLAGTPTYFVKIDTDGRLSTSPQICSS
jgi:hypothetical protein